MRDKLAVFIRFYAPERFLKENAFSVTVTVTKRQRCVITGGCLKKVEVGRKKAEAKCPVKS